MKTTLIEKELVYEINGCVFEVYKGLGHGFLEKVYENGLIIELEEKGLTVERQKQLTPSERDKRLNSKCKYFISRSLFLFLVIFLHQTSCKALKVAYKGHIIGEYVADIIVNGKVLIELKAQSNLLKIHEAQILNYLKATGIKVGLLVNFAYPKASVKRFIL